MRRQKNKNKVTTYIILVIIILITFSISLYIILKNPATKAPATVIETETPVASQSYTLNQTQADQKTELINEIQSKQGQPMSAQQAKTKSALLKQIEAK